MSTKEMIENFIRADIDFAELYEAVKREVQNRIDYAELAKQLVDNADFDRMLLRIASDTLTG